jgi:heme o synthase
MTLTKARLSALVVVTTLAGYLLGAGAKTWTDPTYAWRALHTILGTTLAAFAAAVFNQLLEVEQDALMHRTANRPLPGQRIPREGAFAMGWLMAALGIIHLGVKVNTEAVALAILTIVSYIFVYTPLKRRSVYNTLVGAVSGAIPPMIGWVAVPGGKELSRELIRLDLMFAPPAIFLFALLFIWQLPHFLAINWMYREEYQRGGFVMWCNSDPTGRATAHKCMAWSVASLALAFWPPLAGFTSWWFAPPALALGGWLFWLSLAFRRSLERSAARRLFFATLLYLPAMLVALLICSTLR